MKLPFDLGVKLFFRLLLPGFVLSLGVLPILLTTLSAVQLTEWRETAIVIAMIMLGWLVVAADMPIYMLLEGRRYWPKPVRRWLWRAESNRLARINGRVDDYYSDAAPSDEKRRAYLEASVSKREFPMGPDGEVRVGYPSRLGNTIGAFEQYSRSRYGVEAVFYWPRIWVNLDKELREELDGQQAMADSAVYVSFASACCCLLWIVYGGIAAFVDRSVGGVTLFLPPARTCALIAVTFAALARLVYYVAVFTNAQYGSLFMAVIDSHAGKLSQYVDIEGITARVTGYTGGVSSETDRYEIVRRYLQYFNVKLADSKRPVPFAKVASGRTSSVDTKGSGGSS